MPGTEGGMVEGLYGLNDVPSALLKYDKDKDYAGQIVYIQREIAALTYLIREKMPRVKVSSHEPVLPEVTERTYRFYLTDASGTTTSATQVVAFADEDAKSLQKNDFLQVNGLFYDNASTWATTFTATSGDMETIRILDVDNAGSYASGKTNVTIQRGWGGTFGGTANSILTSYQLTMVTSAVSEGSRSRKSIGKNITTDTNYVQKFRESYEASDFEMEEDFFYEERPEQTNANLASMNLMKKVEFSMWVGKKGKLVDTSTNRMLYTTGGIIPFIPKDTTHQINYGGVLTPVGFNSVLKDVALLGGSEERWAFGGYSAITALMNSFDNKIRLDQEYSKKYGLKILEFEASVGIRVKIVASLALTELGYDWDFFVLDFGTPSTPYFQYMYIDDIYINDGRDGKGIQANDEFIRKEEFVGSIGLIRRAATYQAHIFGITQVL